MQRKDLKKYKLPNAPGVYFFLGARKEILYVGKATSLRTRVRSYFDEKIEDKRSYVIGKMVVEAKDLAWTETESVLEAMLLEVNLIRTHKPTYNTRSKDDKSYNHVVITKEEYPRVLVVRGKDLPEYSELADEVYGPFPNGTEFKHALKLIRKLFQFYDVTPQTEQQAAKVLKGKINFNRQIGLYPQSCSPEEYAKHIRHIKLFFEGKKIEIIKELEKQMMVCARKEQFEQAQVLKKKIFALKHIHDIALIRDDTRVYKDDKRLRIEAYDIAHLSGTHMVGVMTVIEGGEPRKSEYRKFRIQSFEGIDDPKALAEVLNRRLQHPEWSYPDLIVVDGSTAQKNRAERVLAQNQKVIPVVGVVKDERHNPVRVIGTRKLIDEHKQSILLANAEAHRFAITYHKLSRGKQFKG